MAKQKKEQAAQQPGPSIQDVMAENAKLRSTISQLGEGNLGGDKNLSRYSEELKKINKYGKVDTDKITVKEFTDHKNISLWNREGKRIGPLHRNNAIATLNRFFDLGILLSADQPTPEEIEAYKQSPEYIKLHEEHLAMRKLKEKSKRSDEIKRLTEEIAKMAGVTVDSVTKIVKAGEVKSLSAGRAAAGVDAK